MTMSHLRFIACAFSLGLAACDAASEPALSTTSQALVWEVGEELPPSDGASNEMSSAFYGFAIAMRGTTALVGAPFAGHTGPIRHGAVYVLSRADAGWAETQRLTPTFIKGKPSSGAQFGAAVTLGDDWAVVGAPLWSAETHGRGAAFAFAKVSGEWVQTQEIAVSPNGAATNDRFGASVALDGDTLIVGRPGSAPGQGAVHVFERVSGSFVEKHKLEPPTPQMTLADYFGYSVAIAGDRLVVGAPGREVNGATGAGAVYVFERGQSFVLASVLPAPAPEKNGLFGISIAIDGSILAIGAPGRLETDPDGPTEGKVFFYDSAALDPTAFTAVAPPAPSAGSLFGASLALGGDGLLASAPFESTPTAENAGALYAFSRSGKVFSFVERFTEPEASGLGQPLFGWGLAMSGREAIAGAPHLSSPAPGTAYALRLRGEPGDSCASSSECISGFCVDGYCCDSACDSPCEACSAAKKGDGTDGTCGPVKAGTDPDEECAEEQPSSCGQTGYCDGNRACARFADGTRCADAGCVDEGTRALPRHCAGGACVTGSPATESCAEGARCREGACAETCESSVDCPAGFLCEGGVCERPGLACQGAWVVEIATEETVLDCTPYACAEGACKPRCESGRDCAPGNVCTEGTCGALAPIDAGPPDEGCGCRAAGRPLGRGGAAVALAFMIATLVRRRGQHMRARLQ